MNTNKVIMQKLGSLSLILVVLFCQNGDAGQVDCRKFVFAPICRGVAAKRAVQQDIISSLLQDENSRALLNRRSRMNDLNEEESYPVSDLRLEELSNKADRDIFGDQESEEDQHEGQQDPEQQEEAKAAAIKDSLVNDLRKYLAKVKTAIQRHQQDGRRQDSVSRILEGIRGRLQTHYNRAQQNS